MWSCGNNEHGQLGLGGMEDRLEFERIESLPELKQNGKVRGSRTKSARNMRKKEL